MILVPEEDPERREKRLDCEESRVVRDRGILSGLEGDIEEEFADCVVVFAVELPSPEDPLGLIQKSMSR